MRSNEIFNRISRVNYFVVINNTSVDMRQPSLFHFIFRVINFPTLFISLSLSFLLSISTFNYSLRNDHFSSAPVESRLPFMPPRFPFRSTLTLRVSSPCCEKLPGKKVEGGESSVVVTPSLNIVETSSHSLIVDILLRLSR